VLHGSVCILLLDWNSRSKRCYSTVHKRSFLFYLAIVFHDKYNIISGSLYGLSARKTGNSGCYVLCYSSDTTAQRTYLVSNEANLQHDRDEYKKNTALYQLLSSITYSSGSKELWRGNQSTSWYTSWVSIVMTKLSSSTQWRNIVINDKWLWHARYNSIGFGTIGRNKKRPICYFLKILYLPLSHHIDY